MRGKNKKTSIIILQKQLNGKVKLGGILKKRTRHHLLVPHMLLETGERGRTFVLKKSSVCQPFAPVPRFGATPVIPQIITNEKKQSSKG
jgi:hypothetical protein